mgnify:CR=1 FL=1
MGKYVFALRNVRAQGETSPLGVKDAPRTDKVHYFVHSDTGNATAAELKVLVPQQLPSFNEEVIDTMCSALVAANTNTTLRANETTGAGQWRNGKQIYQGGVGYHATLVASAIAAINWKNL